MEMVTVPAASPLLTVGAPRSFLQLIQLLLRPLSNSRSLSHQLMFFAIAPDMLSCVSRSSTAAASRCCSNPHHDLGRQTRPPMSRWTLVLTRLNCRFQILCHVVPKKFSSFLQLTDQELLLGCHAVQRFRFLDPVLCQNDTLVSHWSLANPDSMVPSLIQTVC